MCRLAFGRSLPPSEALGRIRDAFHDYDNQGASVSCDELERGRLDRLQADTDELPARLARLRAVLNGEPIPEGPG